MIKSLSDQDNKWLLQRVQKRLYNCTKAWKTDFDFNDTGKLITFRIVLKCSKRILAKTIVLPSDQGVWNVTILY